MRSAVLNEYRLNGFTVYENAHIGSGALFFGPNVPSGWMPCDGRALSRADYAKLFAEIGTYWGAGDGSTTFNIPDLRDRVPQGADATSLGDYIEAGLPNITGSSYPITAEKTYYEDNYINEGALDTEIINHSVAGGGDGGAQLKLKFDASRSSSVYKDDCDTVQSPAAACYIIIKVTDAGNSGGGSALVPDMTEAEYNALSPEEQNNGQIRHITDAPETPVPFAVVNDSITTSANVLTAQETQRRINVVQNNLMNRTSLDWSRAIETVATDLNENTFTATEDGVLFWDLSGIDGHFAYIQINNTYIVKTASSSTSYVTTTNGNIMISQGDVVKWKQGYDNFSGGTTQHKIIFLPYKTN